MDDEFIQAYKDAITKETAMLIPFGTVLRHRVRGVGARYDVMVNEGGARATLRGIEAVPMATPMDRVCAAIEKRARDFPGLLIGIDRRPYSVAIRAKREGASGNPNQPTALPTVAAKGRLSTPSPQRGLRPLGWGSDGARI